MFTEHSQILRPPDGLKSTPAEAHLGAPPPRPSPAEVITPGCTDLSVPDSELTTKTAMRIRMRELVARVVALSERIVAEGVTREELDSPVEGEACRR